MIYFDNAAATKTLKESAQCALKMMTEEFGNPSSLHSFGFAAEKSIDKAEKDILKCFKNAFGDFYFTSGGTEANNIAILGFCRRMKRYGRHIITSFIEHPSVINSFEMLKDEGFKITYAETDSNGIVNIEKLAELVKDDTIFVSIMNVNNEIGSIQNINEIGRIIKKKNENVVFHSDCVQSFTKQEIDLKYVDIATVSGHKIHAPKGVGGIYIKKGIKISPIGAGGSQQRGIRPGTENTPAICAFACSSNIMIEKMKENEQKAKIVKNELIKIQNMIDGVNINGSIENGSPYILNLSFEGVKAEVLLHALEKENIYVSTGAACSSRQKKHKTTVSIIAPKMADSSLRFSFCAENTLKEAQICRDVIIDCVKKLRKYKKR